MQRALLPDLLIHGRFEELDRAAVFALGAIQSSIRVRDQGFGVRPS